MFPYTCALSSSPVTRADKLEEKSPALIPNELVHHTNFWCTTALRLGAFSLAFPSQSRFVRNVLPKNSPQHARSLAFYILFFEMLPFVLVEGTPKVKIPFLTADDSPSIPAGAISRRSATTSKYAGPRALVGAHVAGLRLRCRALKTHATHTATRASPLKRITQFQRSSRHQGTIARTNVTALLHPMYKYVPICTQHKQRLRAKAFAAYGHWNTADTTNLPQRKHKHKRRREEYMSSRWSNYSRDENPQFFTLSLYGSNKLPT